MQGYTRSNRASQRIRIESQMRSDTIASLIRALSAAESASVDGTRKALILALPPLSSEASRSYKNHNLLTTLCEQHRNSVLQTCFFLSLRALTSREPLEKLVLNSGSDNLLSDSNEMSPDWPSSWPCPLLTDQGPNRHLHGDVRIHVKTIMAVCPLSRGGIPCLDSETHS